MIGCPVTTMDNFIFLHYAKSTSSIRPILREFMELLLWLLHYQSKIMNLLRLIQHPGNYEKNNIVLYLLCHKQRQQHHHNLLRISITHIELIIQRKELYDESKGKWNNNQIVFILRFVLVIQLVNQDVHKLLVDEV